VGRLPRGTHSLSREQVAANQRVRLVSALVEVVGEQGYAGATMAQVVERAGVSRRAFYELFANLEECFLAAYDMIVDDGLSQIASLAGAGEGPREFRMALELLFARAVENPAAHRLVLLEAPALGPMGVQRRERLIGSYEAVLRERLGVAPRPGLIPNPLLRAIVGGIIKVLYTRVQAGAQRQLKGLIEELVRWPFSYSPLPAQVEAIGELRPTRLQGALIGGRAPGSLSPWSASGRGRAGYRTASLSRSFLVHSQRERILDAVAQLSAEKGYAETTVEDIAARAAVSLQAFYEHFADKEDALLVAYELGHDKGCALVERVHDAAPDWPTAVRAGVVALLEYLASEPAFAHLALVDAPIATPRSAELSNKGIVRYAQLLTPGFEQAPADSRPPQVTIEAIIGAIFELCLTYTLHGRTRDLTELTPWVTYIALAPFLGPKDSGRMACRPQTR
jgi:AcrR family transcriptional regulator